MIPTIIFIILFFVLWGDLIAAEPLVRGTAAKVANWTARFRYRDYLAVIVLLLVGGAVAAVAGDEFLDLSELVVANNSGLHKFDSMTHDWAVRERNSGSTAFFAFMTTAGGPVVMGLLTGIIAGALFVRKRPRWAVYLLVTAGGGALLNMELKRFYERARPALAEMLRRAHGYSFPSGHAMGATVVLGALAYLVVRTQRTWRQKSAVIAAAVTVILAVASSRIYLGVHWVSDVVAGITCGCLWLATTTIGYETFRRIRLIRAIRMKRGATTSF